MFTSAPSQVYVNISISNDAVVEQQEMFRVRLSTTDQSVNLTQDEATVIINDNTGKVTQGALVISMDFSAQTNMEELWLPEDTVNINGLHIIYVDISTQCYTPPLFTEF